MTIDWNSPEDRANALQVLLETVLLEVPAEHLCQAVMYGGHRCTVSRAQALIDRIELPLFGEMVGIVQLAKQIAAESDRHNRTAAYIFQDAAALSGSCKTFFN